MTAKELEKHTQSYCLNSYSNNEKEELESWLKKI